MSDGPRLVVIAHPRSGSNSLVEILDCHPELTLLDEPFNENFSSWLPANPDYRALITDVTSLDRVVDGRVLELCYEDLFLGERSTRWRLAGALWAHLGLPSCENPRVGRFLENASFRMGKSATYGRLPNLAELEGIFGNDETGHISYLAPVNGPAAEA